MSRNGRSGQDSGFDVGNCGMGRPHAIIGRSCRCRHGIIAYGRIQIDHVHAEGGPIMDRSVTRRTLLKAGVGTSAAWAISAASYARVKGANDRISIAQIGCGGRGLGAHMTGIHPYDKEQNVEVTAVCDPWRLRREKAAAQAQEWYG